MMFREKTMLGGVFFSKTGSGFFEMAWGGMLPQLGPSQFGAPLAAQIVSKTVQDSQMRPMPPSSPPESDHRTP